MQDQAVHGIASQARFTPCFCATARHLAASPFASASKPVSSVTLSARSPSKSAAAVIKLSGEQQISQIDKSEPAVRSRVWPLETLPAPASPRKLSATALIGEELLVVVLEFVVDEVPVSLPDVEDEASPSDSELSLEAGMWNARIGCFSAITTKRLQHDTLARSQGRALISLLKHVCLPAVASSKQNSQELCEVRRKGGLLIGLASTIKRNTHTPTHTQPHQHPHPHPDPHPPAPTYPQTHTNTHTHTHTHTHGIPRCWFHHHCLDEPSGVFNSKRSVKFQLQGEAATNFVNTNWCRKSQNKVGLNAPRMSAGPASAKSQLNKSQTPSICLGAFSQAGQYESQLAAHKVCVSIRFRWGRNRQNLICFTVSAQSQPKLSNMPCFCKFRLKLSRNFREQQIQWFRDYGVAPWRYRKPNSSRPETSLVNTSSMMRSLNQVVC